LPSPMLTPWLSRLSTTPRQPLARICPTLSKRPNRTWPAPKPCSITW
jgi:hypothetical protein